MLQIETIAIGDELLTGKISDTNSTFFCQQLFAIGGEVKQQTVIPDQIVAMRKQIKESASRSDVVICFGGLGPTTDDLTVDCVAEMLGCAVVEDARQKEKLLSLYKRQNREVNEAALRQVRYPKVATPLANSVGLAPGFRCEMGKCIFFFLPGVPAEMKEMVMGPIKQELVEKLNRNGESIHAHFWRCVGIWESQLQTLMDPLGCQLPQGAWFGYRVTYPETQLLLYFRQRPGDSREPFQKTCEEVRKILQPYSYTEKYESLEQTVVSLLKEKNATVALAESCTGGLALQRLTRIPGASDVVWGGLATYQIAAKKKLLGVEVSSPEAAVSPECSLSLAHAVKKISGCSVAGGITGFLGPESSAQAPSGTAFTAVVGEKHVREHKFLLSRPDRESRQWGASTFFLDQIRREIESSN